MLARMTGQQAVEFGKGGICREDGIEAAAELGAPSLARALAVGLEVGIEPPEPCADALLLAAPLLGEAIERVDQPLGVDPAERMMADIELAGIVGEDDAAG